MRPGSRGVGPATNVGPPTFRTLAALVALAPLLVLPPLLALPSTVIAADERSPQPPEDVIAALEKADPGSPEALSDRLEYAGQLIDATEMDCHQRLDAAQSQLDGVARNQAADVVLPNGRAQIANTRYRLKLARSSCGVGPAERESDLRESLAAAQQAVPLYRDALDYESMANMQFNVGVTQRMLGDNDSAVASLDSAVAMDREYGFRDDEEDNSKLLALWKGSAQPPVAGAPDTPARSVSLKFAWAAHEATVGIQIDHVGIVGDSVVQGSAYRPFKQHVQARGNGWVVSYDAGQIAYDVPAQPGEPSKGRDLSHSFGRDLLLPGFDVNAQGDFKQITALKRVAFGQSVEAVADRAQESYDFETGVWIGATLEQGVWYNMSGQLVLPGTQSLLFPYDVAFAYTRDVACSPGSTSQACVEIVVHATPDAKRLSELLRYANRKPIFQHDSRYNYSTTTTMRIVTDPNTLTTYEYEVRRYWHASGGALESTQPENHFERLVSTFTYP